MKSTLCNKSNLPNINSNLVKISIILTLFLSIANLTNAQTEATIKKDDFEFKALGQSGKMSLTFNKGSTTSTHAIVINMASIAEVDKDSNEVGKAGSTKHSFNNFAQLDFSLTTPVDGKYQNLDVTTVTFQTPNGIVGGRGKIEVKVQMFGQDGKIKTGKNSDVSVQTTNSEDVTVKRGDIKFSITLTDWPFCIVKDCSGLTCCKSGQTNEEGAFVDFSIEIKTSDDVETPKKADSNEISYQNGKILLSNDVKVDGVWKTMPAGYPKQDSGKKTTFVFRFEKFVTTSLYDPVVSVYDDSVPAYGDKLKSFSLIILTLIVCTLF